MLAFRIEPIRTYDAGGRLAAAGVRWNEQRLGVCYAAGFGLLAAVGLMIGGVADGFLTPRGACLYGAGTALGWVSSFWVEERSRRDWCVVFEGDGRIATPCGLFWRRAQGSIDLRWDGVRSIEYSWFDGRWLVQIFAADGGIWSIARPTARTEAHRVVTQLTLALQEIRDAERQPAQPEDRMIA